MLIKWLLATHILTIQLINANNLRQLKSYSNLHVIFPKCTTGADCSNHGICNTVTNVCLCDSTYVSHVDLTQLNAQVINNEATSIPITLNSNEFKMCNYGLKSQLTALMLSIFIGFGSEHFYMENNSVAAGKFVFYIMCYYLNIAIFGFYLFNKAKRHLLSFIGVFEGIYLGLSFAFMFLWNLYDWIKIGKNEMPDGKGYNLYSWNMEDNPN